ncbi:hypothetical protein RJ639_013548 [Escallonia herrerae]|uniref:Reverse transcriptase Ty1/copia-type domain-containing protein n=1 Tax=Escallonia herrerae TaxID=1293975 RepID=A0AA88VGF3_9ASTE|nr:hypothetical protein RJ639_013548 [Escallonia herrerae]
MRQEPGQSINTFLSQMHSIWDQLALSEPKWDYNVDNQKFTIHRDRQRLVQFLMALTDDFESVRASLLHRSPFQTLEAAISDLLYEETRLGSLKSQRTDVVLATSASRPFKGNFLDSRQKRCKYCHESGHFLLDCPIRICKMCHRKGPSHYLEDCPKNPMKQATSHRPQSTQSAFKYGSNSAAITTDSPIENSISTSQISISEIADILKQVLSNTGNPPSTALSTISGISDLKHFLGQNFLMKDLGVLSYFLGLEISSSVDGYTLSQAKYASDLLSRAGLTDSKTAPTPLEPNVKLTPFDGSPLPFWCKKG